MSNIFNPNFGSGLTLRGGPSLNSKLVFDAAEHVLRSNSNTDVPPGFHATVLHNPACQVGCTGCLGQPACLQQLCLIQAANDGHAGLHCFPTFTAIQVTRQQ